MIEIETTFRGVATQVTKFVFIVTFFYERNTSGKSCFHTRPLITLISAEDSRIQQNNYLIPLVSDVD